MILAKKDVSAMEAPNMSRDELESEWRKAKECFDKALAQKAEVDKLYVAAATQLNMLERLVKRVEKQDRFSRRVAARTRTED